MKFIKSWIFTKHAFVTVRANVTTRYHFLMKGNEDLTRGCEDGNPNSRLKRATLDDFLTQREMGNHLALNFLDLPLIHSSVSLPIG